MSRSRTILLLLVVLCVAVGYAWMAMPKQHRVASGQNPQHQTGRQPKASPASFPIVADLDFTGGGDNPYQKPQKNLFAPLYLPAKKVKRPPAPHPVAKVIKPVVRPQKAIPVVIQPQGPKPIQPLDILGHLRKEEATVFLASKQGDIFLVKAGDTFAADLVVHSINAKNITIGRRHTDQQVVLRLGEVKSQRLPKVRFQSDRPEFKMAKEPKPVKPKQVKSPDVNNKKVKNDAF